ncbi:MAG: hypothetical protein JNN08_30660 [Bryobacterales bacterium]|nr:hypothetical protein [Bryobacterales bacterium]
MAARHRPILITSGEIMAGRGPQTFQKRQKEQQRKEKQEEKRAKRLQKKLEDRPPEPELELLSENSPADSTTE